MLDLRGALLKLDAVDWSRPSSFEPYSKAQRLPFVEQKTFGV